jgi:hypothetical protein
VGAVCSRGGHPARRRFPGVLQNKQERSMSNPQQSAQGSGGAKKSLTYKQMSAGQKTVFILKLAVCIVSFGMIFPNIMSD